MLVHSIDLEFIDCFCQKLNLIYITKGLQMDDLVCLIKFKV